LSLESARHDDHHVIISIHTLLQKLTTNQSFIFLLLLCFLFPYQNKIKTTCIHDDVNDDDDDDDDCTFSSKHENKIKVNTLLFIYKYYKTQNTKTKTKSGIRNYLCLNDK
jgi:hypothetical protein